MRYGARASHRERPAPAPGSPVGRGAAQVARQGYELAGPARSRCPRARLARGTGLGRLERWRPALARPRGRRACGCARRRATALLPQHAYICGMLHTARHAAKVRPRAERASVAAGGGAWSMLAAAARAHLALTARALCVAL